MCDTGSNFISLSFVEQKSKPVMQISQVFNRIKNRFLINRRLGGDHLIMTCQTNLDVLCTIVCPSVLFQLAKRF